MKIMRSLSGRLLVLTVIFVMLAEVLIFLPSLASFRVDYLRERLSSANIAAIALRDQAITPSREFEEELLTSAEVLSIALRIGGARFPVLNGDTKGTVARTYDLDVDTWYGSIVKAVYCITSNDTEAIMRVMGAPDSTRNPMGDVVEVTIKQGQLKSAMMDFAWRILILSLIISLLTATLVYLSLNRWLVTPTRRLINTMTDFRQAPELAQIAVPGTGRTEIDEAQRELSMMQTEVRSALQQKTRLASLGEAVAKINHDLRNMLTSAQLLADRLERSDDPLVTRVAPKLLRSLDRATALCTQTLTFGSAEEPPPVRRRVMLDHVVEEVREAVLLDEAGPVSARIDVAPDVYAEADPDHLFRLLQNLMRNAVQAMTASGKGTFIQVTARRTDTGVEIDLSDNGPGMPIVAKENLFKAFKGSVRKGGTGLGLHISRELARGHGGDLELVESTTEGTTFRVILPDVTKG